MPSRCLQIQFPDADQRADSPQEPGPGGIISPWDGHMTGIIRLVLLTLGLIVAGCMLPAASSAQQAANLANYLRMVEPAQVFPEADRFGPLQGSPPVAPAYQGDRLLGYAFLNSDFVNATGYSGKPIRIIAGI